MNSTKIERLCAEINAQHADRVNNAVEVAIDAIARTMTLSVAAQAYAETLSTLAEQRTGTPRAQEGRR